MIVLPRRSVHMSGDASSLEVVVHDSASITPPGEAGRAIASVASPLVVTPHGASGIAMLRDEEQMR